MPEKELAALQRAFTELKALQDSAEEFEERQVEIRQREVLLTDYRLCLVDFKPFLERRSELETALAGADEALVEKERRLGVEIEQLKADEDDLETLQTAYKNREKLLDKARDLERLIEVRQQEQRLARFREPTQKGGRAGFCLLKAA